MIENFLLVRRSGHRTGVGEQVPGVSIVDQINDAKYKVHHYEWQNDGQTYERKVDNITTMQAAPLADGSGILVIQNENSFSSDNVIVIAPDSRELLRIKNPYTYFKDRMPGDEYWFYGMDINLDEVILHIQVRRKLSGRSEDALPLFEAHYNPVTWELVSFNWVPWR